MTVSERSSGETAVARGAASRSAATPRRHDGGRSPDRGGVVTHRRVATRSVARRGARAESRARANDRRRHGGRRRRRRRERRADGGRRRAGGFARDDRDAVSSGARREGGGERPSGGRAATGVDAVEGSAAEGDAPGRAVRGVREDCESAAKATRGGGRAGRGGGGQGEMDGDDRRTDEREERENEGGEARGRDGGERARWGGGGGRGVGRGEGGCEEAVDARERRGEGSNAGNIRRRVGAVRDGW